MNVRRSAIVLVMVSVGVASSFSLIGGLGIELVNESLLPIVPLVIILPALNSLVGDYATLIAAHAGDKSEAKNGKKKLLKAMIPSLVVSCLFIVAMGLLLGQFRGYDLNFEFIAKFGSFVIISILGVVAVMFGIALLLDMVLKNKKLNPDDILIPIITTISDIFMLGLIAFAAKFLF